MPNIEQIGGVDSYTLWVAETTFGTAVTATNHFGLFSDSQFSPGRNLSERRGQVSSSTNGQEFVTKTQGTYDSQLTVNFEPIEFSSLQHIMGPRTGNGSSGTPYVYARANKPASFTIVENTSNEDDDLVYVHAGCVCESWQMRFGENEAPSVSEQFRVKSTAISSTLQSNASLPTGSPYNFDQVVFEAPTGTAVDHLISGVTIRISRDLRWRFGTQITAQSYGFGFIRYEVDIELKHRDDTFISQFLGGSSLAAPSSYATLRIQLSNGASRFVQFNFTNVFIDDRPHSIRLGEDITESLTLSAGGLSVSERTS